MGSDSLNHESFKVGVIDQHSCVITPYGKLQFQHGISSILMYCDISGQLSHLGHFAAAGAIGTVPDPELGVREPEPEGIRDPELGVREPELGVREPEPEGISEPEPELTHVHTSEPGNLFDSYGILFKLLQDWVKQDGPASSS